MTQYGGISKVQFLVILFVFTLLFYIIAGAFLIPDGSAQWVYNCSLLAGFLVSLLATILASSQILTTKISKQIRIYEDECNPELFLKYNDSIAQGIKLPLNHWDAHILCYRCLALIDTGKEEEAKEIVNYILSSISTTKMDTTKARIEYQIHSALIATNNHQIAHELTADAEAYFLNNPKKFEQELADFEKQKEINAAEVALDFQKLITIWQTIREAPKSSLRTKVVVSYRESKGHKALGNVEQERELLDFVVRHGSKLKTGREAQARLREMNTAP